MSMIEPRSAALKKLRVIAAFSMAYVILLPAIGIIMPSPDFPPSEGLSLITFLLMFLMPVEILVIYILYRVLELRTTSENIFGIGTLLFVTATAPAIYGTVIVFSDASARVLGSLMGLSFGLAGIFITWILTNRLLDSRNPDTLAMRG